MPPSRDAIEQLHFLAKVERGLVQAEAGNTRFIVGDGSGIEIFPGIASNRSVRFGKACLKGTRIDVATVIGALAAGESADAVEQARALTHEQILGALRYAFRVLANLPPAAGEGA